MERAINPLLIIPTFVSQKVHAEILIKCVTTLRETTDREILIVDDNSSADVDDLFTALEEYDNLEVHRKEENTGFSSTVNIGLARALAEGRDACLINQDIEFVDPEWLDKMMETDAHIIGALLLYPNYLIQSAGTYFSQITRNFAHRFVGSPPNLPAAQIPCECPVTGALQYVRLEVLQEIGIYDEKFKLSFEDVDYLIRALEAGLRSLYNPEVKAVHHESIVRGVKSERLREWESDSLMYLMTKYSEVDFRDLNVPTMLGNDEEEREVQLAHH